MGSAHRSVRRPGRGRERGPGRLASGLLAAGVMSSSMVLTGCDAGDRAVQQDVRYGFGASRIGKTGMSVRIYDDNGLTRFEVANKVGQPRLRGVVSGRPEAARLVIERVGREHRVWLRGEGTGVTIVRVHDTGIVSSRSTRVDVEPASDVPDVIAADFDPANPGQRVNFATFIAQRHRDASAE